MSGPGWLEEIVRAADPGYARSAAPGGTDGRVAPPAAAPPVSSQVRRGTTLALLFAVGLLLAGAGVRAATQAPERARARAALVAELGRRRAAVAASSARAAALRRELARGRQPTAPTPGVATGIDALAPAAGAAAVLGPGVRVTLVPADTGPAAGGGPRRSPGAAPGGPGGVADSDLAGLVNVLWSAGAEAIAVGGVRLTATSPIRTAGEAILVGFHPVSPPYQVEAVGDPDRLAAVLAAAWTSTRLHARLLAAGGQFTTVRVRVMTLPAAAVTAPRLARELRP
jgi:uncharacterized protein YlxW (UPF0749 family)